MIHGRLPADWGAGYPNVGIGVTAENQEMADQRIPLLLQVPAALHFVSAEPLLGPLDLSEWLHDSDCHYREGVCHCSEPRENHIGWVIVGGETGPKARPIHPDWARDLRNQCARAGTPFFVKQCGEWLPGSQCDRPGPYEYRGRVMPLPGVTTPYDRAPFKDLTIRIGAKAAGHLLDGVEWRQFPEVTP
jgi:protein gp37